MRLILWLDILVILSRRWEKLSKAKDISDKEVAVTHITWVRGIFGHVYDLDNGLTFLSA